MITFNAEIKEVKTKYLVSGDKGHSVTLYTDDDSILEMSKIPSQTLIKVTIEAQE